MFIPKFRCILILVLIILLPTPVNAQTTGSARLEPPETIDFPIIHTYLEVYNDQGQFVHDLKVGDIRIIEDQQSIPIIELEEQEVGVQFVLAVNLGPALGIRDSNGISRYSVVQAAFLNWANIHTEINDDFSLLTNDNPDTIHTNDISEFINRFQAYQTDPRSATPSLDVLVRAINIASDPLPRTGMGRAILLLTPPPNRTNTATIQSIISLARQERIRIYVWMVSAVESFTSEGATLLVELANQTGGKFFAFSGTEITPNIDEYLDPLRYVYALSYESQIRNSEPHQIIAEINSNDLEIISPPQDFNLQVLSPNPMFLSPPFEISRANRSPLSETFSEVRDYTPSEFSLEILVEFPDGLPRPLIRTTLLVDGEIMDENTTSPFNRFTWDLSEYKSNGVHIIKVVAFDSLGLEGSSIENSVQITVQQTPQSILSTIAQNAPLIAGALVSLTGGILILVFIFRGRIRPKSFGRRRTLKSSTEQSVKKKERITTEVQPEPVVQRRNISYWVNRFAWPQRSSQSKQPIAYLELLEDSKDYSKKDRFPISNDEITFGNDPKLATTTFNDPAVDGLHTRIRVSPQGEITIHDEGSIAGTWVNYSPISNEDIILSHGDIIHIGRIGLCLKMTDKNKIPKPIIRPQEERS